jgi:hypothetical protein
LICEQLFDGEEKLFIDLHAVLTDLLHSFLSYSALLRESRISGDLDWLRKFAHGKETSLDVSACSWLPLDRGTLSNFTGDSSM